MSGKQIQEQGRETGVSECVCEQNQKRKGQRSKHTRGERQESRFNERFGKVENKGKKAKDTKILGEENRDREKNTKRNTYFFVDAQESVTLVVISENQRN